MKRERDMTESFHTAKKQRREDKSPPPAEIVCENGVEYLKDPIEIPVDAPSKIELYKDVYIFPTERISFGAYSLVHKGYVQGKEVAIKMLKLKEPLQNMDLIKPLEIDISTKDWDFVDAIPSLSDPESVKNEIEILNALKPHKNIPKLINVVALGEHNNALGKIIFIIMECVKGKAMIDHLIHDGSVNLPVAGSLFKQLCDVVEYCHKKHIIHGDIKCDNVTVNYENGYELKLLDFGFGKILKPEEKEISTPHNVGTLFYFAPEKIFRKKVDPYAGDIWSLGVFLHYILATEFPFGVEVYKNVPFDLKINSKIPSQIIPLLEGMLTVNPEKRFTIDQVQNNIWRILK